MIFTTTDHRKSVGTNQTLPFPAAWIESEAPSVFWCNMKNEPKLEITKEPGRLYGGLDSRRPFVKRVQNRKVKAATVKAK